MRVIAVMLSTWRPGAVVTASISAAMLAIDEVHVWGYEPTGKAHYHALNHTLYHGAHAQYSSEFTGDALYDGRKTAYYDDAERVVWRSKLSLDMWVVLRDARALFPGALLVYLENDAVIIAKAFIGALDACKSHRSPGCSCWGQSALYSGSGSLCYFLKPAARPERHLLAYHMVQPADWIMGDYSKGTWPVFNSVTHGTREAHASTRLGF
jgi:hypothetical protein